MFIIQQPFKDILAGIHTALLVNEGIVKLTGGPGTGKSALCAQLYRDLEERGVPVIFFMNPPRDAESLQHDILRRLELPTTGNFTRTLTRSLLAQPPVRNALVLLFDDAHDIDARTFTSIRMLCNIQDDTRSLVRIVICGTEELDAKLASAELRGISQYLNQSFRLDKLTPEQVQDFRSAWWLARGQVVATLDERALQQLYRECKGHLASVLDILLAEAQAIEEQQARRERQAAAELEGQRELARAEAAAEAANTVTATPFEQALVETTLGEKIPAGASVAETIPATPSPPETAVNPAPESFSISAADVALVVEGIDQLVRPKPVFSRLRVYTALTAVMVLLNGAAIVHYIDFTPPLDPLVVSTNPALPTPVAEQPPSPVSAPAEQPDIAAVAAADVQAALEEAPAAAVIDAAFEDMAEDTTEDIVEEAVAEAGTEPLPDLLPELALPLAAEPALTAQLEAMLTAWAASWQQQDLPGYFSHYHQAFVPESDPDLAAWRQRRQNSISLASEIAISIDSLAIQESSDASATVQLWLRYRAQGYADDTLKEIQLLQVDGRWQISSERNLSTQRL